MSPMNRKRGVIGLAVLCTATLAATAAVAAPQEPDVPAMTVPYHVTDLSQPGGAEALYARIQRAARDVCSEPDQRELARWEVYKRCFDRAVDSAVAKVNVTALTALHRNKAHGVGV
jgi:UrcA family protein